MDEIFRQLESQILQGDTEAAVSYLRQLSRLTEIKIPTWHRFLLRQILSLFSDDGFSQLTFMAMLELVEAMYGDEIVEKFGSLIRGVNNEFLIQNERFPEVCKILNLKYLCSICDKELFNPEEIQLCFNCEEFFCESAGPNNECPRCYKERLKEQRSAQCNDCHRITTFSTLHNCSECSAAVCSECLARFDPISRQELTPELRHLCDDCYFRIYAEEMERRGLCIACEHPIHSDEPCAICQCEV